MKALVLCGGIPQKALIEELKSRGIYCILVDMNENVVSRPYADKFYPVSVFDVDKVKKIAEDEKVDFVLTACADQVILVQAQVSEMLNLPCYISYETAKAVSSKELMKKVFGENDIPTSKYVIMSAFDSKQIEHLSYPIIVKPVDSYSSRGVKKVYNVSELEEAFLTAVEISRTNTAIIEEYVDGDEITVDAYIEDDGAAKILCISNIDKIPNNDKFVICRTRYPAQISKEIELEVKKIANKIAKAFYLKNSPLLIQAITNGQKVSVVEFCARTGGGDKFRLIKQVSGFDVIKAIVDITLGEKPCVEEFRLQEAIVDEFLYAKPGIFDHLEGFEELVTEGVIKEYYQLKSKGAVCQDIKSSGDRVAYFTIQAENLEKARVLNKHVNEIIKIYDRSGMDILRHDLIGNF